MNIVNRKNLFFTISGIIVGASVVAMIIFGFSEGIDFKGGTLWQLSSGLDRVQLPEIETVFKSDFNLTDVRISSDITTGDFLVRTPPISEPDHQKFLNILNAKFPGIKELSFESIGPSIGAELRSKAIMGIIFVLVGISIYIAFAFRKVYRPVSSWKYGVITLITLFHDVMIPAGLLAILGYFSKAEIDSNFIVALLVVMGFSVHDTIVVFDRIRENLFLDRGKTAFGDIINQSINQTLARSINTSLTLIIVLVALIFTGPANLFYFVLTLLVGVVTGIYSSIFIASPALLLVTKDAKSR
jgi:preprotein translocase subunit SecF